MFKRILTGVIAFCFVLVPVLFFADTVVLPIAVALFTMIATYEVLHCVGLHKNLWVSVPVYLVSGALPFGIRYLEVVSIIALPLALCVILIYLLAAAVFSHGKADIGDVSTALVLWIYTLMGFAGLMIVHDFIEGGQYFRESDTLSAGDQITTFEIETTEKNRDGRSGTPLRCGLMICYDIRFPEFAMKMAIRTPVTRAPPSIPPRAVGPRMNPQRRGAATAMRPGTIISFRAALVEMETQVL